MEIPEKSLYVFKIEYRLAFRSCPSCSSGISFVCFNVDAFSSERKRISVRNTPTCLFFSTHSSVFVDEPFVNLDRKKKIVFKICFIRREGGGGVG